MTAPHIVDPAGLLGQALSDASPDLMRELLQTMINALLSADADSVCGAEWNARTADRTNRRNGYRHRPLDTRVGTVDVAVPKLRSGSYFPEWLLERRKRAESALITVVADCYLAGVSTRRMDKLVKTLGIDSLSKSQVSRMAEHLDEQVAAFRHRGQRRRPPRGAGHAGRHQRDQGLVEHLLRRPCRPRPGRGATGDLRCPRRARRGDRGEPAGSRVAALPHPLRGEPHGRVPQVDVAGAYLLGTDILAEFGIDEPQAFTADGTAIIEHFGTWAQNAAGPWAATHLG